MSETSVKRVYSLKIKIREEEEVETSKYFCVESSSGEREINEEQAMEEELSNKSRRENWIVSESIIKYVVKELRPEKWKKTTIILFQKVEVYLSAIAAYEYVTNLNKN